MSAAQISLVHSRCTQIPPRMTYGKIESHRRERERERGSDRDRERDRDRGGKPTGAGSRLLGGRLAVHKMSGISFRTAVRGRRIDQLPGTAVPTLQTERTAACHRPQLIHTFLHRHVSDKARSTGPSSSQDVRTMAVTHAVPHLLPCHRVLTHCSVQERCRWPYNSSL